MGGGRRCGGGGGGEPACMLLGSERALLPLRSPPARRRGGININYVSKGRLRLRTGYTSSCALYHSGSYVSGNLRAYLRDLLSY